MLSYLIKFPILKRLIPSLSLRILKFFNKNRGFFRVKNLELFLDFLDPIDREIILSQNFEKDEINFLINMINFYKIKNFLDIGANCGYYSLFVTKNNFKIKTIAFEPNQEAYYKFSQTLKKNFYLSKRILLHNYGLSNINSKLKIKSFIKHGYAQTGGSSVEGKFEKNKHKISLENFFIGDEKLNFKNTTLAIKIDVEGHELHVLKGIKKLIKNNKCIIQIEIFRKNFKSVNKFLESKKFKIFYSVNKRSNYFYKNFI